MDRKKISDLPRRLLTSSIVIMCASILIAFSPHFWVSLVVLLFIAALAGVGVWEYVQLAQAKDLHPSSRLMISVAVIEVGAFFLARQFPTLEQLPLIVLFIGFIAFFIAHFKHAYKALAQVAIELFGVCYVAIPLCFMIGILYPLTKEPFPQDGRWWLMYLIVVTKITDVGAYFVGKLWGRHKLAPFLSPKKTVEGAAAGFCCAVGASVIMYEIGKKWLSHSFSLTFPEALWMGMVIGILAQIGDLSESLLKRDAFVKDSNRLPGLGGVLDMLDSLLLTAPVVYFFLSV
jgi:phosphatidate cytidylyltransferase